MGALDLRCLSKGNGGNAGGDGEILSLTGDKFQT